MIRSPRLNQALALCANPVAHRVWRVMMTCVLFDQVKGSDSVAGAIEFFRIVSTPNAMMNVDKAALDHVLRPRGHHLRRFTTMYRMTRDYLDDKPVELLYGMTPAIRGVVKEFSTTDDLTIRPNTGA